jgi:hypothetical protein
VVDVAHDGDNRRARDRVAGLPLLGFDLEQFLRTLTSAPNSRAIIVAVSMSSVVLSVIMMRLSSSFLRTSLVRTSSLSARSLTVIPSASVIERVIGGGSAGIAGIGTERGASRRRGPPAGLGGIGGRGAGRLPGTAGRV